MIDLDLVEVGTMIVLQGTETFVMVNPIKDMWVDRAGRFIYGWEIEILLSPMSDRENVWCLL